MNKAAIVALLLCVTTFTGCIDGDDTTSSDDQLDPVSNLDEEELSQKFANLSANYESLAVELATLVSNYESALLLNIELQNDVQDLQVELSHANSINAAMNSTVAELEEQLQDLTSDLEESNDNLEQMHEDYNQLNSTYNSVKNDINNYTFLIDSAEYEYVNLQNSFNLLQSQFNSLSSDYDNMTEEFDSKMNTLLTTASLNDERGICPIGNPGIEVYTGFDDGSGNGTAGDGVLEDDEIEQVYGVGECGPKTHSFFETAHIFDAKLMFFNGYLVVPYYIYDASYMGDNEYGYYLFNLTTGEIMPFVDTYSHSGDGNSYSGDNFEIVQSGDILYLLLPSFYQNYATIYSWDGFASDTYGRPSTNYLGQLKTDYFLQPDFTGGIFFSGQSSSDEGIELFYSNGTSSGTGIVKDINPGSGSSNPRIGTNSYGTQYSVFNSGVLYFTATDGSNGTELWRSDGTSSGTVMIKDINSGSGSSAMGSMVLFNNRVYFNAYEGSNGYELWVSDGSSVGTKIVKDIRAGSSSSYPSALTASDDVLYFIANDGSNGTELWKTDGTEEGTELVKDIRPGSSTSSPNGLFFNKNDEMLYFYANDGVNGTELWKSDGTEIGTNMVTDLNNGSGSGYFYDPVEISGYLYFRGFNGTTWSLWKTDGTDEGTYLALDFSLGKDFYGYTRNVYVSPDEFVVHENDVYFLVEYNNLISGSYSAALYWFDLRHH